MNQTPGIIIIIKITVSAYMYHILPPFVPFERVIIVTLFNFQYIWKIVLAHTENYSAAYFTDAAAVASAVCAGVAICLPYL